MIVFFMLVILILTFTAGAEAVVAKQPYGKRRAALTGLAIGAFLWNAYLYWPAFPAFSICLIVLALGLGVFQARRGDLGRLRRMLSAAGITLVALLIGWQVVLVGMVNAEVVTETQIENPDGSAGTAFVLYHPGRTGFQELIVESLAESLTENGWRVEITTASREAPTNLASYDLVVLSTPTYDWLPSRRLQRYLDQLEPLRGTPTTAIITGEGYTRVAEARMATMIREAGGELIGIYPVWLVAPNEMRYESGEHPEIMREVTADILAHLAP